MTAAPQDTRTLRSRVIGGLAWSVSTMVIVLLSRLVFGVVLARLLTPAEYGLAGMALVFSVLVLGLSDLALGAGLVQRKQISEADQSTVFWTSAAIGLLLMAGGIALSGPIAGFFGEPKVQPLAALSVSFLVVSLGRVHAALFHREMDFRAISIRVLASTLAAGVVGVAVAVAGYGAWALIAQGLVMAVVSTALLWAFSGWRPSLVYSLDSLRDLGAFGFKVSGTRALDFLSQNADRVLIGRFLGSASLGLYSVAYTVVLFPLLSFLVAVQDTLFPALSKMQDDRERLRAAWLRASRFLAAVALPAALGLVVVAPDFVAVVLGAKWLDAVPVLRILAVVAIVLSVSNVSFTVLTALDRAGTVLRFSVLEFAVLLAAVAFGLRWGIEGVAVGFAVGATAARLLLTWLTTRELDCSVAAYFGNLFGVVQAAAGMTAVVWVTRLALVDAGAPAWLRLAVAIALGLVTYAVLCWWRSAETVVDVKSLRRRRAPDLAATADR